MSHATHSCIKHYMKFRIWGSQSSGLWIVLSSGVKRRQSIYVSGKNLTLNFRVEEYAKQITSVKHVASRYLVVEIVCASEIGKPSTETCLFILKKRILQCREFLWIPNTTQFRKMGVWPTLAQSPSIFGTHCNVFVTWHGGWIEYCIYWMLIARKFISL
jgi:hypothetical protein